MIKRTPAEVLKLVKDEGIEIVDIRFADLPGMTQHFSVPAHELEEARFSEGFGFDGSSIRGFQEIQESDMLLLPDPNMAYIDPFRQHKTLNINCFIHDPVTKDPYSRDPIRIRGPRKAEGSTCSRPASPTLPSHFGPEAEYFIFDHVEYGQGVNYGTYRIDSIEGHWNTTDNRVPEPRLQDAATRRATSRSLRTTSSRTSAARMILRARAARNILDGGAAPRGSRRPAKAEMDMRFDTLWRSWRTSWPVSTSTS